MRVYAVGLHFFGRLFYSLSRIFFLPNHNINTKGIMQNPMARYQQLGLPSSDVAFELPHYASLIKKKMKENCSDLVLGGVLCMSCRRGLHIQLLGR
jgi:hypothetical protein